MGTSKAKLTIDQAKCLPCSELICVGVCPLGVLEPGKTGKVEPNDEASCTKCGVCADLCPAKAITIHKNGPKSER